MPNETDFPRLALLIDDTLTGEANELALYLVTRYEVLLATESAIGLGKLEVSKLIPEAVALMCQYELGLTDNQLYIKNFASIRALMQMDAINIHTFGTHMRHLIAKNDKRSKLVVRDLLTRRHESLTYLVLLTSGAEKAKEFNFKLKEILTLSGQEERFFENLGV
jgi:hypothetical protein